MENTLSKDTSCDGQAAVIPEKPLSLIMEITQSAGLEVIYEYDDLVFVSPNMFIYQFTETGSQVDIFFNEDCEPLAEQQVTEALMPAARNKGITLSKRGYYAISEAEGENISIEFLETS